MVPEAVIEDPPRPRFSFWIGGAVTAYAFVGFLFSDVVYYNWITTILWIASCFVFGGIIAKVQWIIWRRQMRNRR